MTLPRPNFEANLAAREQPPAPPPTINSWQLEKNNFKIKVQQYENDSLKHSAPQSYKLYLWFSAATLLLCRHPHLQLCKFN